MQKNAICLPLFVRESTSCVDSLITEKKKKNSTSLSHSWSLGLPSPGLQTVSLASPALAGRFFTTSTTWEASFDLHVQFIFNPLSKASFLHLPYSWSPSCLSGLSLRELFSRPVLRILTQSQCKLCFCVRKAQKLHPFLVQPWSIRERDEIPS